MAKHKHRRASEAPVRVAPRAGGGLALLVGGVPHSSPRAADRLASHDSADHTNASAITLCVSDGSTRPPVIPESDDAPTATGRPPRYGYWELMLPDPAVGCPASALLLGLGGGTVAQLLARRCPATRIVGVERDAAVLATAYAEFGLGDLAQLTVAQADAFAWVAAQSSSETPPQYDLICLDLFEGVRLALGAMGTPFLRQVAALLAPDGLLTINLLATARTPDHLRRLARLFTIEQVYALYGNRVIHCRRPHGANRDAYTDQTLAITALTTAPD